MSYLQMEIVDNDDGFESCEEEEKTKRKNSHSHRGKGKKTGNPFKDFELEL